MGGFVALSAHRNRRQIGGIGLQYYPIQPHLTQNVDGISVFVGDHAANAQVPTGVDHFPGDFQASGEAVEYAAHLVLARTENVQQRAPSLAHVDAHGLVPAHGPVQLTLQRRYLPIQGGFVPVEVQANFAHSHPTVWVCGQTRFVAVQNVRKIRAHVAGMQANHQAQKVRMRALQLLHGGQRFVVYVGNQTLRDARRFRTGTHFQPIRSKLRVVQMGVGVDHDRQAALNGGPGPFPDRRP